MAILRCKMCGGDIAIKESKNIGVCEYCGCTVTIPKYDSEHTLTQFNMANEYRIAGEFDKAETICEKIIASDPTNAEAYWCGLLAKYGIEYVEDTLTLDRIPTCHRIMKESILEDVYYKKALEYSDGIARRIYEKEARKINELLKQVLAISESAEPYDIFISYKEKDELGQRTEDSVLAYDLYKNLTQEGYKVFFAKVSLEEKLGEEYEPYIYAALNSAKVMLLVGTKREYFESPWVRNEWSRFLKLTKSDDSKRLIPCYKGVLPESFPMELNILQSQDLSKIGAMQDILHGLSKIFKDKVVEDETTSKIDSRLTRAFQYIEDRDYYRAQNLLNDILADDEKNAKAYVGLLLCDFEFCQENDLTKVRYDEDEFGYPYDETPEYWGLNKNFLRALEVADEGYKERLKAYELVARENYMRDTGLAEEYEMWVQEFHNPEEFTSYEELMYCFFSVLEEVGLWKDADKYYNECKQKLSEENEKENQKLRENKSFYEYAKNRIVIKNGVVIGVRDNGTIIVSGNDALSGKTDSWRDVVKADLGEKGDLIVALTSDGKILCTSQFIIREMSKYRYIDIKAGADCVIGLKQDGMVYGLINGEIYEPDWTNVEKITCDGKLVMAVTDRGRVRSSDYEDDEKLEMQLSKYKDVICNKGNICLVTEDDCAFFHKGGASSVNLKEVEKVKIFDGLLYGIDKKGRLVSQKPTQGYQNYYEYTWLNELVDYIVVGETFYGIKLDGTYWKSDRCFSEGTRLLRGVEIGKNNKKIAALVLNRGELIKIYRDGTVGTNNKNRDLSTWKLFGEINLTEEELKERRTKATLEGNKMFSEANDDAASAVFYRLEQLLEDKIRISLEILELPKANRECRIPEIQELGWTCKQIKKDVQNLDEKYKKSIEEKIDYLSNIIDKAMDFSDTEDILFRRFCMNCGAELREGQRFCSKCGTRSDV